MHRRPRRPIARAWAHVVTYALMLALVDVAIAHGHHGHHESDHHDHGADWTGGDAARAVLASTIVSLASLAACACIAARFVTGVEASARALSDLANGAMLGDALGHQLPSALAGGDARAAAMWCVVGVLAFQGLESLILEMKASANATRGTRTRAGRGVSRDASRGPSRSRSTARAKRGSAMTAIADALTARDIATSGWLNLFADAVHNLTDGVIIAVAFARRGRAAGWATARAALLHELPQEIGDYGVLRHAGFTDVQALGFNLLSALVAVVATALTFIFLACVGASSPVVGVSAAAVSAAVEAFCAGGFLTVALGALTEDVRARGFTRSTVVRVLIGVRVAL